MEEQIKKLILALGDAINETIGSSERIGEVIGDIKRAGYDTLLLLEANICLLAVEALNDGADEQTRAVSKLSVQ